MKYYIIAGEASGDLHASNLMKALKKEDADATFRMWGGDLMAAVGGTLVKHYRDLAFMGFIEVVKNIKTILNNFKICKTDILKYQPDVLILVDYPGFNLRMAKWAKQQGIKVFYYISPQIWAWNSRRVHGIKRNIDKMFVILPFEKNFYKKYNYEVEFVGHPLLDVVAKKATNPNFQNQNNLSDLPIIALLPGSRKQEIIRMLDGMLSVINDFPDYQFVIAGAPSIALDFYKKILQSTDNQRVKVIQNKTYELLRHSVAALVTSGTATLETALFDVPQVVCYKGSTTSYLIAKRLINVKYISLVNLIMDEEIVKELIQNDFNQKNIKTELEKLLNAKRVKPVLNGYLTLKEKLGNSGASAKAARKMVAFLNIKNKR
ncbi:MAG TPA: lipid-A-disaccharide synthase [Phaeodactylibacter sp.]|nr:lipid-A-disaccharide synthase [Phaeodactylibacter sp.]